MIGRVRKLDEHDPVVVPLVALAHRLQALPIGPAPDFRDSLRSRLLAAAAVAPAPAVPANPADRVRDWVEGWRVQRGLAAGAAGMAAVVGIAGVSIAASRSLPGDPFYGVKRSTEDVQLFASRGDVAKGTRQLQFAETRLKEVGELAGAELALGAPLPGLTAMGGSDAEHVADLLGDMDDHTKEGARLLTRAYERKHDTGALKTLGSFAERQRSRLSTIVDELPAEARDEAAASLDLIVSVEMQASALLNNGACGDDCATPTPTPTATSSGLPQPQPQPQPEPSEDPGAAPAPQAPPAPEPTASEQPSPEPTPSPDPEPTQSPTPSPSPTPKPSRIPVPLPSPVGPIAEDVVEDVESLLPTPLPPLPSLPPAPAPSAPPLP